MHPVLFEIGPYPVYSYGVCLLLGCVVLFAGTLIPAQRAGYTFDEMMPIVIGVVVGGVVGARVTHLLVEPQNTARLLDFYSLLQPGNPGNIIGLMIGGYIGGVAMQRRFGLRSLSNYFAPALAAGSIVWRVGCFLAGCCYGKETDLPWAIHLHDAERHPTMVYEGLFNVVMLGVLLRLRGRAWGENDLLHLYFISYAFFRFWLEYLRVYPIVAVGLTGAQILCLAILGWQMIRLWNTPAPRMKHIPDVARRDKHSERVGFILFMVVNALLAFFITPVVGRRDAEIGQLLPWLVNGGIVVITYIFRAHIALGFLADCGVSGAGGNFRRVVSAFAIISRHSRHRANPRYHRLVGVVGVWPCSWSIIFLGSFHEMVDAAAVALQR